MLIFTILKVSRRALGWKEEEKEEVTTKSRMFLLRRPKPKLQKAANNRYYVSRLNARGIIIRASTFCRLFRSNSTCRPSNQLLAARTVIALHSYKIDVPIPDGIHKELDRL